MLLMQIEAWDDAIKSCNSVLKVQPNNVKALFRKAKVSPNFTFLYLQLVTVVKYNDGFDVKKILLGAAKANCIL